MKSKKPQLNLKSSTPKKTDEQPNLTAEEQAAIAAMNTTVRFPKGTIILKEGEIPRHCFYIYEGIVRQYYLKDGEERTVAFYTEEQSISITSAIRGLEPSSYFLECVEDCKMGATTVEQEKELYERFPRFQTLCRLATEKELTANQEHFAQFMTSTPEERYLNVLKNRPELTQRVPQYQLASYLGVKPESLSRIRKRLADR